MDVDTAQRSVDVPIAQNYRAEIRQEQPQILSPLGPTLATNLSTQGSYSEMHVVRDGGCYSATVGGRTYRTELQSRNPSSCKAGANPISPTSRSGRWSPLEAPEKKKTDTDFFESVTD
jgi:hypothetical protein